MDVAAEHRQSYHRLYGDSLHPSDSGPSINNRAHRQTQSMFHNDHSPSLSSFPSGISNRSHVSIFNRMVSYNSTHTHTMKA